jgi:hypothetical protein
MKLLLLVCSIVAALEFVGCSPQRLCWEAPPVPPVDVASADIYEDGGTAFVVFTDGRGCEYRICLDGRESEVEAPRSLYVNATYPTQAGARILDPEGSLGSSIHRALAAWLEEQMTERLRESLFELNTVVGLSEPELRAARVFGVLRGFEARARSPQAASD